MKQFIAYISTKFKQISLSESLIQGDVTLIWTRSSSLLPVGQIRIDDLVQKRNGYPFGLIIEHAFVIIDEEKIFEKADPKPSTLYQITSKQEAFAPYQNLNGFELTRHRRH